MIPISHLPELSTRLADTVRNFEQKFTDCAATRDEIKELATKFGTGVWDTISPKLEYAAQVTEHGFGADGADGWIATLTIDGWLYHHGGVQD